MSDDDVSSVSNVSRFAFMLGQVMGMANKDAKRSDVYRYLWVRGIENKDLDEFQRAASKIANAFYEKETEKN